MYYTYILCSNQKDVERLNSTNYVLNSPFSSLRGFTVNPTKPFTNKLTEVYSHTIWYEHQKRG